MENKLKKYKYILLDVDDTLMDFKLCEHNALKNVLIKYNLPSDDATIETYSKINDRCWKQFEKGEIKREEIFPKRFTEFLKTLNSNIKPMEMNQRYFYNPRETDCLIPGATELLDYLQKKYPFFVITNGVAVTQKMRPEKSGIKKYFKKLYISEELGFQKPQKEFFDFVLNDIGAKKEECLIIGDSLSSDILGGKNSGIDTVFVNILKNENINNIPFTFEVENLSEIKNIL